MAVGAKARLGRGRRTEEPMKGGDGFASGIFQGYGGP